MGSAAATAGDGPFWPFFLYNLLVALLVVGMLVASYLLGQRSTGRRRATPYESGVPPTGSARLRYGTHFYTVGILFILFDIEAVFLYAWAVAFRELGWAGYLSALLFIAVLFLGLAYVWKLGGLDWSPTRRRPPSRDQGGDEADPLLDRGQEHHR